ncbi:MAG: EAL domain-containing protein [Polyangiales bacterium]|nr:EAL domain-containing protein [Sandaracinaceae bacterium]
MTRRDTRRPPADEARPRVLFVDDERHVQRAFEQATYALGVVVELANSATQALRAVERSHFDVIAVDLSMPGLDGLAMVERLREVSPSSAFVLVSGAPSLELPSRPDVHLDALVVVKPWDPQVLKTTLLEALERAEELALRPSTEPLASVEVSLLMLDVDGARAQATLSTLRAAGACAVDCHAVASLAAGLDALDEGHFDLLLMDMSVTEGVGMEALLRLRLASPDSAIVVLSARWDETSARHAVQLGAQDCLEHQLGEHAQLRRALLFAVERKRFERRSAYIARYDYLTGLPNRASFRDRLAHALARFRREDQAFAVLLVDIDDFRSVNEALGQAAGDRFLREVAHRIQQCLREGDTLARLERDEFAVILEGPVSRDGVAEIGRRVREVMREPLRLGETDVVPRASIGAALCPDTGDTVEALIDAADSAMYGGKRHGGDRFTIAGQVSTTAALSRLRQEGQLRYALERNQFTLEYQPKWSPALGRTVGVEALIRWRNINGEVIPPNEFVPVLESLGLIVPVGAWVIDTAIAQLARWHRAGARDLHLAVNLSPIQLEDDGVLDTIRLALERHALAESLLEVEITETTLLRSTSQAHFVLGELRRRGVRVALDDFGTGHSSLANLATFEVDSLKIDRSFVLADNPRSQAIVASIIDLAHRLGLTVVAEGVETQAQHDGLVVAGCDLLQGYLLGRPTPADQLPMATASE